MKQKYKYTCVVCGAYSLLQYLLVSNDEDGTETFFVIDGDSLYPAIYNNLPESRVVIKNGSPASVLWFRIKCLFKWKFRKNTEIYAVDLTTSAPMIIANYNYTLLEEAPNLYIRKCEAENDIYDPNCLFYPKLLEKIPHKKGGAFDITSKQSFLWKLYARITHGKIYRDILGTNNQCINRLYTNKDNETSPFLQNCKATYLDYKQLWENASEKKKNHILKVFGATADMIALLTKSRVVVYTNPLMEYFDLSEQEVVDIYRPFIKKYESEGIVIKPHPREYMFDYAKNFPNCLVFPKTVPSQLFELFDVDFKTAITVYSSAITSLPADTKIIWIGTKVHPKIYEKWSNLDCPDKFTNVERVY